ncbi:MAG: ATP-binding cassette domain-containing protein [Eubacteriales bacterium]|nr:ATP-binding cassette domain-containing protein [Eubacteriales bacterium]
MPIVLENIYFSCESPHRKGELKNVSLTIEDGEFVGVLGGKSGGASALTAVIGRVYAPLYGNVKIINGDAVCVFSGSERFLSESTVEKQLLRRLSGKELGDNEKAERISASLEAVGLDFAEIKDVPPLSLPLGKMRLVSIAEALLTEAETILLDDPMENMSVQWSVRLMECLKKLNDVGKTVIIASDDAELLSGFVKRIIIMKDGEIVRNGSTKTVLTDYYDLLRLGIDIPQTVLCARALRENGIDMPDNVLTYQQLIDRLKIIMWRKAL